jgi:hypothetical protein
MAIFNCRRSEPPCLTKIPLRKTSPKQGGARTARQVRPPSLS